MIQKALNRTVQPMTFGSSTASKLVALYGSPLYVYDENVLRESCKQIKHFLQVPNLSIYYSAKANTNIALLKIIREEGLNVDAMTINEIYLELLAGFDTKQMMFLSNNVSKSDFVKVNEMDIYVCVDSISQLERYFQSGGEKPVCLRINTGKGVGHHQKVVTAGAVKFGIDLKLVDNAFSIAKAYHRKINGFNSHIGSSFLNYETFHQSVVKLLDLASKYSDVDYIDFGGGFGIVYNEATEKPFPINDYVSILKQTLLGWEKKFNRKATYAIQPGRSVVAKCGYAITTVQSIKSNAGINFVGTDLGFNLFLRPEFYGTYHKVSYANESSAPLKKFTITGNVCEAGDILGKDRLLPENIKEGDCLVVHDAGAYSSCMASNYNSILKPAEILICKDGDSKLIRKRDTLDTLTRNQIF